MTESELDTTRFFKEIGVDLNRIAEGTEKTPDFYFETGAQKVFVEVKEIKENEDEKKLLRDVEIYGQTGVHDSPELGKRFRPAIQAANRQLKQRCLSGEAGLIIIQDVRDWFTRSIVPQEEIKIAMFGDRITWIGVNSRTVKADLYNKNKTTTEMKNTTVSAIGLLIKNVQDNSLSLHVYHNPHAKNALVSTVFFSDRVFEYRIFDTKAYGDFKRV
jgi:hypothetical protein